MHRIGTNTAGPNGTFTDGNPQQGVPPTNLNANWFNAIQDEIIKLIEEFEITPATEQSPQNNQLIKSLYTGIFPIGGVVPFANHSIEVTEEEEAGYNTIYNADGTEKPNPTGAQVTPELSPPRGFMICDGSRLARATYSKLFKVIGTRYSVLSTGPDHFLLPDYRAMFLRGSNRQRTDNFRDPGVPGDGEAATQAAINFPDRRYSVHGASLDHLGQQEAGTQQGQGVQTHTHSTVFNLIDVTRNNNSVFSALGHVSTGDGTAPENSGNPNTGNNETRPNNITVEFLIRAF